MLAFQKRYRRITDELSNKGLIVNHKTVPRLIKLFGLKSIIPVKYTNHTKDNKVKQLLMFYSEILKQRH
jgi:hypothetical protein